KQRARARAAQKKDVIEITDLGDVPATNFIGFDDLTTTTKVQEVVKLKDKTAVILETSPFYAEMGGQLGDSGEISHGDHIWRVANTQKAGDAFLHLLGDDAEGLVAGIEVEVSVDAERRAAIQRHHSVTHIFHWALHEVASKDATQKGSYVGPDKLTFDFNSAALTPRQLQDIEKLVNERIVENAIISWTEVPYTEARENAGITQLFGEKYGETVRVVQIGGKAGSLNGWSMELCGGTHTRATGEIGLFRIVGESAIAAGTRRIEAIAGLEAYAKARQEAELIVTLAGKVNSPIGELEKKLENLIAQQKQLEKQLKSMKQKQAGANAKELIAKATEIGGKLAIIENMGDEDGNYCQAIADALKGEFNGVVVLAGSGGGSVALVATVAKELTGSIRAGEIIKEIAPIVGGKGGGKPDQARGGGKDVSKVGEALEKARALLAG
ncbi:MAG: alanyl-tRNA synthetase, partial [Limisphaerales bacterium]